MQVWDGLVRVTHWSVALLVVWDLVNEAGANPSHRYIGFAAGALVLLRLIWGLIGSRYSRLSEMATSALALPAYVRALSAGSPPRYAGHNPLGAWMAFALWTLVLVIVATGWALEVEAYWGDETLQTLHAGAAYTLAAFALVHVAGVIATSILQRVNLVKAMITGDKQSHAP